MANAWIEKLLNKTTYKNKGKEIWILWKTVFCLYRGNRCYSCFYQIKCFHRLFSLNCSIHPDMECRQISWNHFWSLRNSWEKMCLLSHYLELALWFELFPYCSVHTHRLTHCSLSRSLYIEFFIELYTCTCCFWVLSMLGSMLKGPSTLIISSFSRSQGPSWLAADAKLPNLSAHVSSSDCRCAAVWLAFSHRVSKKRSDGKYGGVK